MSCSEGLIAHFTGQRLPGVTVWLGRELNFPPMNPAIARIKELFPVNTHNRVFLVGGTVRDVLLGRNTADLDLAAALSPEDYKSLGFHLVVGKSTSAIWFRHEPEFGLIEVTPLENVSDLEKDLSRRDFTINAIAMQLSGNVVDPLAFRSDLTGGWLRPCSSDTFTDDPLRILRAFRFLADGWRMTSECDELIRRNEWNHSLEAIPIERISREMIKALGKMHPELFFQSMLEFDIGQSWLPEIFHMPHIPAGPLEYHPEGDLFTHSVQVLQRVSEKSSDPISRFCGFFHDIGKLATPPALYPKHHGHEQKGVTMAYEFSQRLRLPKDFGIALSWISRLHGTFNLWNQLRDSTKLGIAEQAQKSGIAEILPLVAAADNNNDNEPKEWRSALEIADMSAQDLGIDLVHLEGIQPSKRKEYLKQKRIELFRVTQTSSI